MSRIFDEYPRKKPTWTKFDMAREAAKKLRVSVWSVQTGGEKETGAERGRGKARLRRKAEVRASIRASHLTGRRTARVKLSLLAAAVALFAGMTTVSWVKRNVNVVDDEPVQDSRCLLQTEPPVARASPVRAEQITRTDARERVADAAALPPPRRITHKSATRRRPVQPRAQD